MWHTYYLTVYNLFGFLSTYILCNNKMRKIELKNRKIERRTNSQSPYEIKGLVMKYYYLMPSIDK